MDIRGKLHIGTSGYQYNHWQTVFYPRELAKKDWFAYYTQHFDTVEINSTFYRLPSAETFAAWRAQAPPGFCYALKFSRYSSHLKRLKDPAGPLKKFLERASRLGEFLGPILVQLPPHWRVNTERLAHFLTALPREFQWAIEFRDPSWLYEDVFALLETANVALCLHDLIPHHPRRITADWVYVRFHGGEEGGNYTLQALHAEARRITRYLTQGRDVFAYFNNDAHGYAVRNAIDLKRHMPGGPAHGKERGCG